MTTALAVSAVPTLFRLEPDRASEESRTAHGRPRIAHRDDRPYRHCHLLLERVDGRNLFETEPVQDRHGGPILRGSEHAGLARRLRDAHRHVLDEASPGLLD